MSNLTLTQGVTSGYLWPIVTPTGDPADLDGYSARCQVRESEHPTSTLLTELTARAVTIRVEGAIVRSYVAVTWTDTESREWAWTLGHMDVILRDADGDGRVIVWQGTVAVDLAVTERGDRA